ncbi:hypothetical protein Maes01_01874 [Microbulbifer aestuariivivens]|uniref:Uncharacterized protein n=1 Tax=Microbulbifer aestuariivivens TaxID=1908308 RepID=A0ABP9WSS0_9GAMM
MLHTKRLALPPSVGISPKLPLPDTLQLLAGCCFSLIFLALNARSVLNACSTLPGWNYDSQFTFSLFTIRLGGLTQVWLFSRALLVRRSSVAICG